VSSTQRIAEVSERCGLRPRADVDSLTSDARAALAIAAALVASPAVLLLDDALGAVRDPERRVGIAEALREARSRGATLVVASNGSDDLTALSSRIVTLERGRLDEGLPSLRRSGEATWAL
jgi:ABC-type multidrug transport system ATPase subunit